MDIVQVYFKLPRGLQKGSSIDALNKVHDILIDKISKKYEKWLKRLVDKHMVRGREVNDGGRRVRTLLAEIGVSGVKAE